MNGKSKAIQKIAEMNTLPEVLRVLAVEERSLRVPATRPDVLPLPVVLSATEKNAMRVLAAAVESAVVPVERRMLADEEVARLMEEREAMDAAEKAIFRRKEAQRTAVFNHLDVALETADAVPEDVAFDKDGHYIAKGDVFVPGSSKRFAREVREGSASLTSDSLEAQIGDGFTRDDFLACTTQVRVLDEAKVMLLLRKRPELVEVLKKAVVSGNPVAALYVRGK